jgi:hypothetical protein
VNLLVRSHPYRSVSNVDAGDRDDHTRLIVFGDHRARQFGEDRSALLPIPDDKGKDLVPVLRVRAAHNLQDLYLAGTGGVVDECADPLPVSKAAAAKRTGSSRSRPTRLVPRRHDFSTPPCLGPLYGGLWRAAAAKPGSPAECPEVACAALVRRLRGGGAASFKAPLGLIQRPARHRRVSAG